MTPSELRDARRLLGEAWGLGRPLAEPELARALQLKKGGGGETVRKWEQRDGPTGPAAAAIQAWLDGAAGRPVAPRVPLDQIVTPRGRPVSGED